MGYLTIGILLIEHLYLEALKSIWQSSPEGLTFGFSTLDGICYSGMFSQFF